MKIFHLCIALLICSLCRAQPHSPTVDRSAPAAPDLSKIPDPVTRIKALTDYCDSLKAGGYGSAVVMLGRNKTLMETAWQALTLVPAGDAADSARFLSYIAYSYAHRMELNPDSVLYYYSRTLDLAARAHSIPLIANACGSLLHIAFEMGHPEKADEYKKILQSILDTSLDNGILRDGYSMLGGYYQHKAYYSTAQDYYLKTIAIRKRQLDSLPDPKGRLDYANQCYLLAKLYMNTDMPDKALGMLYEGNRFKGLTGLTDYRFISAFIDAFCKMGKIDSALYYLHTRVDSLEIRFRKTGRIIAEVVMPNLYVAEYYLKHGEPETALPYLNKADTLARSMAGSFLTYEVRRFRGKYFLQVNQPAKAIAPLAAALPMAALLSRENYTDILRDLASAYRGAGNMSAALQYYDRHVQSLDSLTNERISRTFADQETRYQTNEKEERISSLDKDNRLKMLELGNARHTRILLVLGLVALGTFALLLYFVYRNKETLNRKLEDANRQLAVANDTKARLFGIISHDLRAPVSSIIQLLTVQQQRPGLLDQEARRFHEEKIRTASAAVLDTMEEVLLWSKSQMSQFIPQLFPAAIAGLIQKEVLLLRGMMEDRQLQLSIDLPPGLTRNTDDNFLSVILRNLLQNAVKYSEMGTMIHISADTAGIYIAHPSLDADAAGINALLYNDPAVDSRSTGLGLQIARDLASAINATISFHKEQDMLTAGLYWDK